MREKTEQRGFTLVEVITVVAIIGILAAVALPAFLSWLPNIRLKTSARDLFSTIQKAKLEAVKRNTCTGISVTTVAFPATGGDFNLFIDDGTGGGLACNGQLDGGELAIASSGVGTNVSLVSATGFGVPATICFNSRAAVCGSESGNIQFRNNQSRWYRITVAASGGVKLEVSGDGITWSH